MNNDTNNSNDLESLNILRKIKSKPNASQRELAQELGISLGKLNYCLNALIGKGLVKIKILKRIQKKLVMFTF